MRLDSQMHLAASMFFPTALYYTKQGKRYWMQGPFEVPKVLSTHLFWQVPLPSNKS